MDNYFVILAVLGFFMLGMAWMPMLTSKIKISYSILYVFAGAIIYQVLNDLPIPDPIHQGEITVRITELVVIVSLMGTGLKIDEPFSFRLWRIPLKLVSITMLLSIIAVTLIGVYFFGLDLASSILLGAVLAPTDPVLADDVQVGPPLEKRRSEVRFSLTAEAGLNDGMAFPFTWLAITLALLPMNAATLWEWFAFDFIYRLAAGFGTGFVAGKLIAYLIFTLPRKKKLLIMRDGFVALSSTLLVYGGTELISGYGFVAVFVCAVTIRNYELGHEFNVKLHSFTDQIERMLMAMVLLLFGGTLVQEVFTDLNITNILFALVLVFIIRPATAFMSVFNHPLHAREKAAISFYGIKGIGSFFYLAYAIDKASFPLAETLWDIVATVVLLSIIIHGISATVVMDKIGEQFGKDR